MEEGGTRGGGGGGGQRKKDGAEVKRGQIKEGGREKVGMLSAPSLELCR